MGMLIILCEEARLALLNLSSVQVDPDAESRQRLKLLRGEAPNQPRSKPKPSYKTAQDELREAELREAAEQEAGEEAGEPPAGPAEKRESTDAGQRDESSEEEGTSDFSVELPRLQTTHCLE